jgi:hypothetical protein
VGKEKMHILKTLSLSIEDIEMIPTKTASISPYSEQRNFINLWPIASRFRMG